MGIKIAPKFIAGVVSAALYLIVFTFGLGFLFLFLPTLPIFWLGLRKRSDDALHATLIATILLSILFHPISGGMVYLFFLGLPAWYIAHESMKFGGGSGLIIWFPITIIFARLMAVFSFTLLAVTLYYTNTKGGLPGTITPFIYEALAGLSKEINEETRTVLQDAAPKLSFLIFAVSAWMWGACLYLHGWVVSRELKRQNIPTRPDMVIHAFPPPNWMIPLLLITAFASLVGGPSLAFWGKSSLIILLFPYFLFGLSLLHIYTRKTEQRFLLLFCAYFIIALFLWPVFIVAGTGFIYHIKMLNKYLPPSGNSSKR